VRTDTDTGFNDYHRGMHGDYAIEPVSSIVCLCEQNSTHCETDFNNNTSKQLLGVEVIMKTLYFNIQNK